MFSLFLVICINHAGFETCESKPLYSQLTREQCIVKMDNVLRDVKASPFHAFEWELTCEKDN